jgi:hypothetical protein
VVPPEKVGRLRVVTIALDACCGDLRSMQYHPGRRLARGTDHKEFFAEMTEANLGFHDFHPFNRAEMKTDYPDIHALLVDIWGPVRR